MRIRLLTPLLFAVCLGGMTRAQSPPAGGDAAPEGLTRREILSNERVRVQSITLEPDATIPSHTHEKVHITVALGSAELIDIAADDSERRVSVPDGGLNLVPPGTTHALRNDGDAPFRAIAIDLLAPQTGLRNRCATLLVDQPPDCAAGDGKAAPGGKGGTLVPQLESDQTIVSLMTLGRGAEHLFKASDTPPVVVALEGADAKALIELRLTGAVGKGEKPLKGGDATTTVPKSPLLIRNTGPVPARFVVVEFKR